MGGVASQNEGSTDYVFQIKGFTINIRDTLAALHKPNKSQKISYIRLKLNMNKDRCTGRYCIKPQIEYIEAGS